MIHSHSTKEAAPGSVFDTSPYPHYPLEASPCADWNGLFLHCIQTAFYRRDGVHGAPDRARILDVGCGSGWKTLMLALANPAAQITAIDPSSASIEIAQARMKHHGLERVRCLQSDLAAVAEIGGPFDYVNCDELFSLLPDTAAALRLIKPCLEPGGIVRFNLHSRHQREGYYRGQEVFRMLGLMKNAPGPDEAEGVAGFMRMLHPDVELRKKTWIAQFESANSLQHILMNYLLEGDRGSTIPEVFRDLADAGLRFISMVNWDQWRLQRLFTDPAAMPPVLVQALESGDPVLPLALFELLNPTHRRLDFWACRDDTTSGAGCLRPMEDDSMVRLHPVLGADPVRRAAEGAVKIRAPFCFTDFVSVVSKEPIRAAPDDTAALLPLWERPQRLRSILSRGTAAIHELVRKLEEACLIMQTEDAPRYGATELA